GGRSAPARLDLRPRVRAIGELLRRSEEDRRVWPRLEGLWPVQRFIRVRRRSQMAFPSDGADVAHRRGDACSQSALQRHLHAYTSGLTGWVPMIQAILAF